jgi:uncharacterized protein (DUF1697 family)
MEDVRALCRNAGFAGVETYIASGNVVFESKASASRVKPELEQRLLPLLGKSASVAIRTASEMRAVLEANPFPRAAPNLTYAIFLDKRPPPDTLDHVAGRAGEEIGLGAREIFVHYPHGMGRSKLRIPAAKDGTARNLNTVAKLVAMASK